MLIQKLVDNQGKKIPDGNGGFIVLPKIEVIFFNDPVLIKEFSVVKELSGHHNHLHVKFAIPDRVLRENGTIDENGKNLDPKGKATKPDGENTRKFSN